LSNKKIIKILFNNDGGGVEVSEKMFMHELQKQGFYILGVIVGGSSPNIYSNYCDKQIFISDSRHIKNSVIYKGIGRLGSLYKDIKTFINIVKAIDVSNLDEFIVSVTRPSGLLIAGLIGRKFNIPVHWHIPGPDVAKTKSRIFILHMITKFFGIVALGNSKNTARYLGYQEENVIYPGFDKSRLLTKLTKDQARNKLNFMSSDILFGVIARLTYVKAPDIIIEAFLRSEAFKNGAKLVFFGDGKDEIFIKKIHHKAKEKGFDRIFFTGNLDDVSIAYRAIDVSVHAIRITEGFGISVAESCASGVPVIASSRGGPPEYIENGKTGWLVGGDEGINSYTDVFNLAWKNKNKWSVMGELSAQKVKNLSIESQVEKYLQLEL
jgi:glycosyltransferase involved in cell wall biosynthesis